MLGCLLVISLSKSSTLIMATGDFTNGFPLNDGQNYPPSLMMCLIVLFSKSFCNYPLSRIHVHYIYIITHVQTVVLPGNISTENAIVSGAYSMNMHAQSSCYIQTLIYIYIYI
jgi:hypothetical protein